MAGSKMRIVVLALVAALGFAGGALVGSRRADQNARFFLRGALQQERQAQENAAFRLYADGPSPAAAWAYEQLLLAYGRHASVTRGWSPSEEGVPASMFAHLRLYTIYAGLNQSEKAQAHLAQASQLSGGRDLRELMSMLDQLDRQQRP